MKVESHYHLNLLVENCRREMMRRVQRLNLHLHSKEAKVDQSKEEERIVGMHEVRHPLFVIVTRRKAIMHNSTIGTQRYAHFVGRKAIMWHLVGRRKPHSTS
jgi:hypothetical protein